MSNDISYVIKVADDFSSTLRKYQSQMAGVDIAAKKSSQAFKEASTSSKFFTQNLLDLGKATGIYFGAREVLNFGKGIFQARVEMDGLQASLAAIMPKFDKTKSGTQLAAEEIEYLKSAADRMGISFQAAAPEYMKFLASSKADLPTARKTFESFAGISRLYGLSASRFGLVMNALSQIQGKTVVNMEELKLQLGDSLPNAMQLFADAAGYSVKEFYKLVEQGRVGAGILTKVSDVINKKFGEDMIKAAKTLGGRTEVLGNQLYYLKTTLSDQLAPTFSNVLGRLTNFTVGLNNTFAAINNQQAFSKLNEDLKALVTLLRIASGLIKGFGDIFEGFGILTKAAWEGGKDLVKAATITAYGVTGGDKEITKDAYKELWQQMQSRTYGSDNKITKAESLLDISKNSNNAQKVDVNINLNNAPRGTTIETTKPAGKNVRVGNIVNYQMQEAY